MCRDPGNDQPSVQVEESQAHELQGILNHYAPEISRLFAQVLTVYAGSTANTLDEKQKKARLREQLEDSIQS